MLHDGTHMTDDEFFSNFLMDRSCIMQLNRLVELMNYLAVYLRERSSMLQIMVLLKNLGSYGNKASFQKNSQKMGISKCAVNQCAALACSAILKL